MDKETVEVIRALKEGFSNSADKICLATKELTLTVAAQSIDFTSYALNPNDVFSINIKVKKAGSPTDATHLVRYTQASGDTPTTSHGMWHGDGDYFEVSNRFNVLNSKFISADGGAHILTIEFYGKN